MDYLKTTRSIIDILNKSGYSSQALKIQSLRDGASVGSELLMSVTHELMIFINTDSNLKDLIGHDTNELKDFCWSIGLLVR